MPQIDTSTFVSQLFWFFASFGSLYCVFSFYIIPNISKILFNRQQEMKTNALHVDYVVNEIKQINKEIDEFYAIFEQKSKLESLKIDQEMEIIKKEKLVEIHKKIKQMQEEKVREFSILFSTRENMIKNMFPEMVNKIYNKILSINNENQNLIDHIDLTIKAKKEVEKISNVSSLYINDLKSTKFIN